MKLYLYHGASPEEFRASVNQAAISQNCLIQWDTPGKGDEALLLHSGPICHTLYLASPRRTFGLCYEIGRISGLAWVELSLEEDRLWTYALYQGERAVDHFCSWPEYWEDHTSPNFEAFREMRRGSPEKLAELWKLPTETIAQYVRQWREIDASEDSGAAHFELTGKAYPSDRYMYGDYQQAFDFLSALGGQAPFINFERHCLRLPTTACNERTRSA